MLVAVDKGLHDKEQLAGAGRPGVGQGAVRAHPGEIPLGLVGDTKPLYILFERAGSSIEPSWVFEKS